MVWALVLGAPGLGGTALAQSAPAAQANAWQAYQAQLARAQSLRRHVVALPNLPAEAGAMAAKVQANLQQQRDAVQANDLRAARKLHRLVARQLRRVSRYVQRRLRSAPNPALTRAQLRSYFVRLTEQALALRDSARRERLEVDYGPLKQARSEAKQALEQGDAAAVRAALRAYRDAVEELHAVVKPAG